MSTITEQVTQDENGNIGVSINKQTGIVRCIPFLTASLNIDGNGNIGVFTNGGTGAISVPNDHFFPDETARDTFFTSEIDEGTYCVIEGTPPILQRYQNEEWVDITPVIVGQKGEGVPAGGTTGQSLVKASSNDFDTEWQTVSGGTATPTSIASTTLDIGGSGFSRTVDLTSAQQTALTKANSALQTESDPVYTADKPTLALKSEIPNISGLATKTEVQAVETIANNKLDATDPAADSAKLGGKLPSDYATAAQGALADTALQFDSTVRGVHVALEDGDDNADGLSQANSYQSIEKVAQTVPKSAALTITIYKYKTPTYQSGTTPVSVWNVSTNYAVNDRCASEGYVFQRITAGSGGTAPTPASPGVEWAFVNLISPSKTPWTSGTTYAAGDTLLHTASNLTYVCVQAHTASSGNAPVNTGNDYWQVCGEFNPVVIGNVSLTNFGTLSLKSEADGFIKTIIVGTLSLINNKNLVIANNPYVSGDITLNSVGVLNCSRPIETGGSILGQIGGSWRFLQPVKCKNVLASTVALLYFQGAVEIETTTLAQTGFQIESGTNVMIRGSLSILGLEGANTAIGMNVESSSVTTYGNISISGFQSQIRVRYGGSVVNSSATTTFNKGAGNTTATCYGIQVNDKGAYVKQKGTAFAGDLANTHSINVNATFIDWANINHIMTEAAFALVNPALYPEHTTFDLY